jgi:hypothetical protein
MSKISKIVHIRAPLIVRNFIGKREVTATVDFSRDGNYGGATVVIEGDRNNPALLQVRVGWCRFNDNYCKKKGIEVAKTKDPVVVELVNLPTFIADIEDEMLTRVSPYLRHNDQERTDGIRDWNFTLWPFLPRPKRTIDKVKVKEAVTEKKEEVAHG